MGSQKLPTEFQINAGKTQAYKSENLDTPMLLTAKQVEKLRLILSTYQDGTGMLKEGDLPGWRDFERSVALVCDGRAQESKHVFDVIIPDKNGGCSYGISCKMRGELSKSIDRINRKGRVSIEMANAAKGFWDTIKAQDINESTFRDNPKVAGIALINLVRKWHEVASLEGIDLNKSFYLVLEWDGKGRDYQLFQYSLQLPDPSSLRWYFPVVKDGDGEEKPALRLSGDDAFGTVFDWYGSSGGQLKYYPLTRDALWHSDKFQLAPLPKLEDLGDRMISKAKTYFPLEWNRVSN